METRRPEAHMLHMQHAQMIAVITRQHDAAPLKAHRDAAAMARPAAAPDPSRVGRSRKIRLRGPQPA